MQLSRNPSTFFLMGFNQSATHTRKGLFGQFLLGDIEAGADVPGKRTVSVESGNAEVEDPTVLTIVTAKPILHVVGLSAIEGSSVGIQTALHILCMNPFNPTISQLCFERATREFKPWLVEIGAQFVRAGHSDHHRSGVRDQAKARFTLLRYAQALLVFLSKSSEDHKLWSSLLLLRNTS